MIKHPETYIASTAQQRWESLSASSDAPLRNDCSKKMKNQLKTKCAYIRIPEL